MKLASGIFSVTLALVLGASTTWAQTEPAAAKPNPEPAAAKPVPTSVQTFTLTNVSQPQEANELLTALRNLLDPRDKMTLVPSGNAIIVESTPDQLVLARKILNDLDQPKKWSQSKMTYRLTYTITDIDGGKRVGSQHYSMVVVTGLRTQLKQGAKVPVVTGSYSTGSSQVQQQFTYLDIGMNFDATLDEFANGVRLRTKVEQLSVDEEKSGMGPQDPVVRQTALEGTSFLTPGKPLVLGSLDVPGTTRHLDIDVVMELVQ
ncbi:secretin N-terminal domain-containing protein [Edaphobacter bradus]|uniref:secretin N-terminal domain-containing protein n=1 Tax=Edaphobacter bradus TaxID=2259016 RepID=UPI0021DF77D0|nr:secretin N-terminal domain-containing protein [Edaphobacter bradus]